MNEVPSVLDRLRVRTWTQEKRSRQLLSHARRGDTEWVKLLLSQTSGTLPGQLFDVEWWMDGVPDTSRISALDRAVNMVRMLFSDARHRLPLGIDPAGCIAAFDRAKLRALMPPGKFRLASDKSDSR